VIFVSSGLETPHRVVRKLLNFSARNLQRKMQNTLNLCLLYCLSTQKSILLGSGECPGDLPAHNDFLCNVIVKAKALSLRELTSK
jgi:hypothetical protein